MSESKLSARRVIGYLKEKKSLWLFLVALIAGVLLLLFGGQKEKSVQAVNNSSVNEFDYERERELEARVSTLCSQVAGVSDVTVMITLDAGVEEIYAFDEQISGNDKRSTYVFGASGQEKTPVPVKELAPTVRGVAIVCRGGENPTVQLKLTEMISALFGIPASAVSVAAGR